MTKKEKTITVSFVTILLFLGLFIAREPVIEIDSSTYIAGAKYIPALYPTLLHIFRNIFGVNYLWAVVILQTILAIIAIVGLADAIVKLFRIQNRWIKAFVVLMLVGTFFVDNLNILDGYETCNLWILTEGLSYPFFFIFVTLSIKFFERPSTKQYIQLIFICSLLTLCRKQMIACFAMVFLYELFLCLVRKSSLQIGIVRVLTLVLVVVGTLGIQNFYQSLDTEKQPFYHEAQLSHLFFFADQKDGEKLDTKDEKELYQEIYDGLHEQHLLYTDTDKKMTEITNAYLYNFLEIKDVYYSILFEYAGKQTSDPAEQEAIVYEIMSHFIETLKGHTGQWLKVVLLQLPVIFSVSIFTYQKSAGLLCMFYSTLMVLVYIGMIIYRMIKKRTIDSINIFASYIIIYIVGTGLASTYAIRSLGRYMFYTCGLFYIAYLLLIIDIYKMVKRK